MRICGRTTRTIARTARRECYTAAVIGMLMFIAGVVVVNGAFNVEP
jgi:hypothetical protein